MLAYGLWHGMGRILYMVVGVGLRWIQRYEYVPDSLLMWSATNDQF